jgi:Smg protein
METNVLDVLIYLFECFLEAEGHEEDLVLPAEELMEAGFPEARVNKALQWLEELAQMKENHSVPQASSGMRVFTEAESQRLDAGCRGFLLHLEQNKFLDSVYREVVIDRVMALSPERVDLEYLKWVVLMVLFDQPGQELAFSYMEDLLFAEDGDLQ